ncbi:MAG: FmdB family zinc ribbon protein [bacterium JZ-2024 1]
MPIYEFRCKQCQYQWQEFLVPQESLPDKCPRCGGEVRKLLPSSVGIAFKGSGFYVTDYRKKPEEKKEG